MRRLGSSPDAAPKPCVQSHVSLVCQLAQQRLDRSDTVARLGGDEFALLLPDATQASARHVIDRVRSELRHQLDTIAPEVTCSIGVIRFERPESDPDAMLRAADALMYAAKRRGRNMVVFNVVSGRQRFGTTTIEKLAATAS